MREVNSEDTLKISELENELNRLKKSLAQKEILFESLSRHVDIGVGLIFNGILIDADASFCKILKISKEDSIGKKIAGFFLSKCTFEKSIGSLLSGENNKISNIDFEINSIGNNALKVFLSAEVNPESSDFIHVFVSEKKDKCKHTSLIKNEQKYRDLINFAVGGILIGSTEGNILDANNLACELMGKNREELLGRHITNQLFCPESIEKSPFRFDLLQKGQTVVSKRVILKDSNKMDIETHTKLMPDGTYQMILHDISERTKQEQQIKESEEKFNLIFNENPIPTVLTRIQDGLIININSACENESGWKKSELIGKTSFDIKLWKNQNERNVIIEMLKKHRNVKNFKCTVLKKDNTILTVLLSASLITINNTPCILSSAIDISSLNLLQKQIIDNEEKYKFLIENLNDLLIQVDSENNYTFVSESYCRLFGINKENTIGKSFYPLVHPEDVKITEMEMKKLYQPPYHSYVEQRVYSVNGWRWIAWSGKAIVNQDGKVEAIISLGRDITNQKEIEFELKRAKELAEENSRLKSAFLSNMSHEIRTPMNAIMGFAELIKKPQLDVEKRDEFANIIVSSSKQLIHIIDDIIEISRIESGLMKLNKTPFYLNAFFQNLQITLSQLIPKEKNLVLNHIPYSGLHNDTVIFSDEVKLKQIMTNLIENSIKFTPFGNIEMGCLLDNSEKIIFYVKDTGIGISPENHKTIFERFRQINNELSWKYSGSGLGLAISKAYVELLGGEIWLESELNKGSIFYVSIPFETKVDFFEKLEQPKNANYDHILNGSKILIVEDNNLNYRYLTDIFEEYQVEILFANNGIEAIEIFSKNNNINLLLMDLKMPQMDGYQACEEILNIDSSAKIIIQSAYSSQEDIDKSMSIGCKAFLSKPINKDELLEVMVNLIKK